MRNVERGIAHRGDLRNYPENTLSAFESAYRIGFKRIEFDVNMTKDGVPVVIHDPTLDRTTNATGLVKQYTWEQLKQFKIEEDECIPSLEEVLLALKGKVTMHIELKQIGHLYPGLEEKVIELLRKTDTYDQATLSSIDHYSLVKCRSVDEHIPLTPLIFGRTPSIFEFAKELKSKSIGLYFRYITPDYVDECEKHGISPGAATVNREEDLRHFIADPRVLICTEELELYKSLVNA
ncbi:hypothetical protein CHH67_15600 [Paenibacillus campinasensis]|uniref:GP-PDE domain-containing protein n=1 Tax=Paenibacillus campinasensis TaxID=66347 RepID=A0A268EQ87_9BACL|nr:hypothetical protein CHH67_15600 [Paenibacillus campinasensis]